LCEAAPPAQIGAASGLFQTFRYTGAILATLAIGLVWRPAAVTGSLHVLAGVMAVVSVPLVAASVLGNGVPPATARASTSDGS
jgi:sugar phosphate permease